MLFIYYLFFVLYVLIMIYFLRLSDAGVPQVLDRGRSMWHHGVQSRTHHVPQARPEAAEEPWHGTVSSLHCLWPSPGQPVASHSPQLSWHFTLSSLKSTSHYCQQLSRSLSHTLSHQCLLQPMWPDVTEDHQHCWGPWWLYVRMATVHHLTAFTLIVISTAIWMWMGERSLLLRQSSLSTSR